MIHELLPLLRGWRYVAYDMDFYNYVVPPGREHLLLESTNPGWVVSATIVVDNPHAIIKLRHVGPAYGPERRVTLTPYDLAVAGSVIWTPTFVWVMLYDDNLKRYAVAYSPLPWFPYVKGDFRVAAPPDKPVTILSWHAVLVEIVDPEEFARSLREVLGTATLQIEALQTIPVPVKPRPRI